MPRATDQSLSRTSLGKMLQRARLQQNLSLAQVTTHTKIRGEMLESLENGDYSVFASEVYAKGFLKNYAKFLGLEEDKVMAMYRRDTTTPVSKGKNATAHPQVKPHSSSESERGQYVDQPKGTSGFRSGSLQDMIYSKRTLTIIGFIGLLLVIGVYAFNQLSVVLYPPMLKLVAPVDLAADYTGDIYVAGNSFQLKGVTSPRTVLRLNGEAILPEADNSFATSEIPLRDSQMVIVISATNQFGRTSTINLTVKKGNPGIAQVDKMSVLIQIAGDVTPLLVRTDGKIQFDDRAYPGDVITFDATSRVQIESNSPTNIKLKINGEDVEVAGINTTWELIDGKVIKR